MQIDISGLIPVPMKEIIGTSPELWNNQCSFGKNDRTYIQAASGKGKTSFLSFLYGIRNDYTGSISLNGENIRNFSQKQWSKLRKQVFSAVFQGLELFDDLSAWDNIKLKNRITGFKTAEELLVLAEKLDIAGFMDKKCGQLSFGQKQRVAIIRALCQPFEYLLADEPFSHLDSDNRLKAIEIITSAVKAQDAGLIITGLDPAEKEHFDKIIVL